MKSKLNLGMPYLRLNVFALKFCVPTLILMASLSHELFACSAIASDPHGSGLVAANYDWKARGGIVFQSPRGQRKTPTRFTDFGLTPTWVSKFASLTVSQFGRDFPMQGMNEAGLLGLVLVASAEYPKQGPLGVLTEVSWLQYQLDMYSTVQEVADHVGDFGVEEVSAKLHWFFCDASRECLLVEFIGGNPRIYHGDDLTVRAVTNSGYKDAVSTWEHFRSSSQQSLPSGYNSMNRFIRLAVRGSLTEESDMVTAIDDVALKGYTAFQTIFDPDRKQMKVRLPAGQWRPVSFVDHEFECQSNVKMLDLQSEAWVPYDVKAVESLFALASEGAEDLTPERRIKILENTSQVRCDSVSINE